MRRWDRCGSPVWQQACGAPAQRRLLVRLQGSQSAAPAGSPALEPLSGPAAEIYVPRLLKSPVAPVCRLERGSSSSLCRCAPRKARCWGQRPLQGTAGRQHSSAAAGQCRAVLVLSVDHGRGEHYHQGHLSCSMGVPWFSSAHSADRCQPRFRHSVVVASFAQMLKATAEPEAAA